MNIDKVTDVGASLSRAVKLWACGYPQYTGGSYEDPRPISKPSVIDCIVVDYSKSAFSGLKIVMHAHYEQNLPPSQHTAYGSTGVFSEWNASKLELLINDGISPPLRTVGYDDSTGEYERVVVLVDLVAKKLFSNNQTLLSSIAKNPKVFLPNHLPEGGITSRLDKELGSVGWARRSGELIFSGLL